MYPSNGARIPPLRNIRLYDIYTMRTIQQINQSIETIRSSILLLLILCKYQVYVAR